MTIRLIRVLFVAACSVMGAVWARQWCYTSSEAAPTNQELIPWIIIGAIVGCAVSLIVFFLLRFVTQELFERLAPACILIVFAMIIGYGVAKYVQHFIAIEDPTFRLFLQTSIILVFGYMGISLGLERTPLWETVVTAVKRQSFEGQAMKIVDTSVIIDGRITDICKTGFVEGTLVIPKFVLKELQNIADSSDVLRRAKGRRGLDIVKALQQPDSGAKVQVVDDDPKTVREVDGKLVALAQEFNGKILTNDFNLNKVAQIEGIQVLNINDLANALKPAVLPDEHMEVKIIKEGKEAFQGVGYLDDGTMVVVDGGKTHMGDTINVVVTSVLQTAAGRMIFGKVAGVVS